MNINETEAKMTNKLLNEQKSLEIVKRQIFSSIFVGICCLIGGGVGITLIWLFTNDINLLLFCGIFMGTGFLTALFLLVISIRKYLDLQKDYSRKRTTTAEEIRTTIKQELIEPSFKDISAFTESEKKEITKILFQLLEGKIEERKKATEALVSMGKQAIKQTVSLVLDMAVEDFLGDPITTLGIMERTAPDQVIPVVLELMERGGKQEKRTIAIVAIMETTPEERKQAIPILKKIIQEEKDESLQETAQGILKLIDKDYHHEKR